MRAALTSVALLISSLAWAAPPDGGLTQLQARMAGKVLGVDDVPVQLPHPASDSQDGLAPLLAAPLTANAAVRIALRNNPVLQATLASEGLSISDATGKDNPAKLRAQQAITALSAQAFKAWIRAVAAERQAQVLRDAKTTAEASGELMRRMVQAGNVSKLAQAQSQVALLDAALALARAEQAVFAARETLTVTLGLWGTGAQYTLPKVLPPLPALAIEMPDIEARVLEARADLQAARLLWQRKQQSTTPDSPDALWDALGDAARVRMQAVQLRSQARSTYYRYRSSWDIAQHLQQELLPLRQFIHDELVLRYNGMLTSVFEVLTDSQMRSVAQSSSVAAQRDFWLAHADLQTLLAGAPLDQQASPSSDGDPPAASTTQAGGH